MRSRFGLGRSSVYTQWLTSSLLLGCAAARAAEPNFVEVIPAMLQSPHGHSQMYIYDGPHWTQPTLPTAIAEQLLPAGYVAPAQPGLAQVMPQPSAKSSGQLVDDKEIAEAIKKIGTSMLDHLTVTGEWRSEPAQALEARGNSYATSGGVQIDSPCGENGVALREYGCSHIFSKRFFKPQRNVTVDVFYFPETRGAFGAYSTMRRGSQNFIVRGDASSEDDDSISFLKSNYFFKLANSVGEDEVSKELITSLAGQLSAAVSGVAQTPQLIAGLPKLDRVQGSEHYFMGPTSARRFTSAPHVSQLFTARFQSAALADYVIAPERMKLLLIDYGDPALAADMYNGYTQLIAESRKPAAQSNNMQLFKSGNGFVLCQLRDRKVVVISGARRKSSPFMLLRLIN